ncbi:hypothetical protein MKW94_025030 [Papaver nudicaule]|uniref:Gamma-interferon-inducible lysosomal thiol reductase n=1 Tax=Papaver nudicaule TaxID=74823 RepID=A0AA41VU43_PAPNU|nr:hypothetical protein [Papaver nudicaule]
MASSSLKFLTLLLVFLVSLQRLSSADAVVTAPTILPIPAVGPIPSSRPKRVSLDFHYDSLDNSSSEFLVKIIPNILLEELDDFVKLTLHPYGKSRVGRNGTVLCQHGQKECFLNKVEACAIHVLPHNMGAYFVFCVQYMVSKGLVNSWEACFDLLIGMDRNPVVDCYNSDVGTKLELRYANESSALVPAITQVPWVTLDEVPLYNTSYENIRKAVCHAYKGTPEEACQKEVGYADETSPTAKFKKRAFRRGWI